MRGRGRVRTAFLLLVGAGATACLAWLSSAAGLLSSGVGSRQPGAGVVEISATTNRVLRQVELGAPNDVETGLGSTWVTDTRASSATVAQLPPGPTRGATRVELTRATATSPDNLAVGEGAVWTTVGDVLYRLDPARTGAARRIGTFARGGLLSGVDVGAGALWIADATRRTLIRLDPASLRTKVVIPLPSAADGVAVGEGAIWVPSIQGNSVFKISPHPGRVVRAIHLEGVGNGVAVGAGSVWVTAPRRDAVAGIDPVSGRVTWIAVGKAPTDVCVSRGSVWVANSGRSTVSRIDPSTRKVVGTVRVPRRPNRIAADERSVWVTFLGAP
jgi:YVTN family beta-propeller protein